MDNGDCWDELDGEDRSVAQNIRIEPARGNPDCKKVKIECLVLMFL